MKTKVCCLALAGLWILMMQVGCEKPQSIVDGEPQKKVMLFNGEDLSGWELFIPDKNVDVNTVWSVKDGIIHCTGNPAGYMRTKCDFNNYKIHVQWRWPGKGGNSGVLLHMSGADKVWPKSIECQLMSTNAGDFWLIDGTDIKEHQGIEGRRVPKRADSSEKPLGQWNTYEIYCRGNNIDVFVNGVLQNKATQATVESGMICLQSEGTPIEFRNVYLEPLD
jgi:hypothetical protein